MPYHLRAPLSAIRLMPPLQGSLSALAGICSQGRSRASPVQGMTMHAGAGQAAAFSIANVLSKPIRGDEVAMSRRPQGGDV